MANDEQAAAWDGEEGAYWAEHADQYDRSMAAHHERLLDIASIPPDARVLDVGCGTGQTTRDSARRAVAGDALGVDLSGPMLDVARERSRAEKVENVLFERGDAQTHAFAPAAFDVVISRFGSMFFDDPVAAFENIGRAQPPSGRLALAVWRELAENEWMSVVLGSLAAGRDLPSPPPDAPSPFAFADPARVRQVLGDAGYVDVELTRCDEPVCVGTDCTDAFEFIAASGVGRGMLSGVDDETSRRALDALRAAFAAHESADGVVLGSSAWLVTATRSG